MMPRFSVVIPCRDRLPLVRRALASLERQSFRDFETILVDDGSRGDVAGLAAAFPGLEVRLVDTGGRGANAARNAGTDLATAAWIAYLDSDDVFLPHRLAGAARRVAGDPADLLASAAYVWRSGRRLQVRPSRPPVAGEDISDYYFAAGERFPTSGLIVRTAVARAVRWDERLRKVQDPDFVIRLVRAGYRIGFSATPEVAIYDDTQAGRISDSVVPGNLRDWLRDSGHLLTPRARAGFEVYALAYETGRECRLCGLGQLAAAAAGGRAPWRLTAKSLYRLLAPVGLFKATAQLALLTRRGALNPELVEYLRLLESAAPLPAPRS
jgi:glycosyltransferase involved in cell wall biosynthesis